LGAIILTRVVVGKGLFTVCLALFRPLSGTKPPSFTA
jgi:hypothetical protein